VSAVSTTTPTTAATCPAPLLAPFVAEFAADEDMSVDELLAEVSGRFSFVCEAATETHLMPKILAEDLAFLAHFIANARSHLRRAGLR
jgi:hypothetical protein